MISSDSGREPVIEVFKTNRIGYLNEIWLLWNYAQILRESPDYKVDTTSATFKF